MIIHSLAVISCLQGLVLSALECMDWQGKAVSDGMDYYPDKNDRCLLCRCNKGFPTMCKTVSCAPPSCPYWEQDHTECCKFECKNGVVTGGDNSTVPVRTSDQIPGTPTDHTVTDLGLRLVASTVTTFLILALLLFLIHRFRQRRLLMTLRRYSRRREQLDDLDSISYSPDFFGIQCPPYEDPPPPYTPPKPQPGEQPPPYEDINTSTGDQGRGYPQRGNPAADCDQNFNNINESPRHTGASNLENLQQSESGSSSCAVSNSSSGNRSENTHCSRQSGNPNWNGNLMEVGTSGQNFRNNQVSSLVSRAPQVERNSTSVHFRNSNSGGHPSITMGVNNKNRNSRNRYSDGNFNISPLRNPSARSSALTNTTAALNLELRNTVINYRNKQNLPVSLNDNTVLKSGDLSSSTTDIGESTTSAESLSSSPESPTFDTDIRNADGMSGDLLSDDANSTVKRFLDRQFGILPKNRRYPTTMSQSWTSAQVSPPENHFRQSISLSSFQPKQESQALQKSSSMVSALQPVTRQNLSRSKSEHLKTNGSLINQPYKGVVKSPSRQFSHVGHAVRVAYKEPDELPPSSSQTRNSYDFSVNTNKSSQNSGVNMCSSVVPSSARLAAAMLDPGDIIVTRRQDELRNLRLSHLFSNQTVLTDNQTRECQSNPRPLQRSLSENSVNSASICSEPGERASDVAISNDVPYPTNSYKHFLQSCLINKNAPVSKSTSQQQTCPDDTTLVKTCNARQTPSTNQTSSIKQSPKSGDIQLDLRQKLSNVSMVHSWHAEQLDSCDDNSSFGGFSLNTLGRNVDRNIEKKTCVDKDVSKMIFPYYKPTNADVEIDRNIVPSSEMRACASQLYNYETEERHGKKDKKRHLFKRHSAGCFPVKTEVSEVTNGSTHSSQKQYQRLKSANRSYDRSSAQMLPDHSAKENHKKRMSSKDRKSGKLLLHVGIDNSPKVMDLTAQYLVQSHTSPERPNSLHVVKCSDTDWPINSNSTSSSGKSERKRSKSLGRTDLVSSTVQRSSQTGSKLRKKRAVPYQQEHGPHSFHQELEHVLNEGKSQIKCPVSQVGSIGVDRSHRAITQV